MKSAGLRIEAGRRIDGFDAFLHREVGAFRADEEKADVVVAVRRREAPGAAAGFAGVGDADPVLAFDAGEECLDFVVHPAGRMGCRWPGGQRENGARQRELGFRGTKAGLTFQSAAIFTAI